MALTFHHHHVQASSGQVLLSKYMPVVHDHVVHGRVSWPVNAYGVVRDPLKKVSPAPPQDEEYPRLFANFIAAATSFDSGSASTSRPTRGTNCCSLHRLRSSSESDAQLFPPAQV